MYYAVQHITRFKYSAPIVENVMEVRLQPRSHATQQCMNFELHLRPSARVYHFRDHMDNTVHFFDIAAAHRELVITANSVVNVLAPPPLPPNLPLTAWDAVDALAQSSEHWEWVQTSRFTGAPPALHELALEFGLDRSHDPLTTLLNVTRLLNDAFDYNTGSTQVDSPIEDALSQRGGVCQDFSHIMLALLRNILHIPCRYVSGYLFHREDDRSTDDATHAWVEVLLPDLGWVGFDPTNNLVCGERHIQVAIGRDYSDVPPTHGFYRGPGESELSVAVRIHKTAAPLPTQEPDPAPVWRVEPPPGPVELAAQQMQQQQ
jgi:transglutaminase-like putative cysteine protease